MRKLFGLGLTAGLFALIALVHGPLPASAIDLDCADFPNQAAAQAHLRANPADPDRLDADRDGIACETLRCPCDRTPVNRNAAPAPQPAPAPVPIVSPSAPSAPPPAVILRRPLDYFPRADELPAGFREDVTTRQDLADVGTIAAVRNFERQNPEVAPDDVTGLLIGINLARTVARADEVFTRTVAAWEVRGWRFAPMDGIGERATVGRRLVDEESGRPSESVILYIRIGAVAAVVQWFDYADLPNFDYALELLWIIEAKMRAEPYPAF